MVRALPPRTVVVFADEKDREPFTEWFNGLKDARDRRRILTRLRRIEHGNFGDCRYLRDGVYELRLFFGPGYRVYFGKDGDTLVLLLCAGDKSTQDKDVENATTYWQEYRSRG